MKKIITTFILFAFIMHSYSQVPAKPGSRSMSASSVEQKSKRMYYETENDKKSEYFIEVKLIKTTNETKLILPELMFETKDRQLMTMLRSVKELEELSQKNGFDLITEMNIRGFSFVDHSFAFQKDQEIHYYFFKK